MTLEAKFLTMPADDILRCSAEHKAGGWRFVQMLCTNTEDGVDVQYSYMKGNLIENWTVKGLSKDEHIPSITGDFLAAFVFENEAHDLFGIKIDDIAIDFGGRFYDLAMAEPMTVISPAQKAAREKAAKLAAAKAAKAAAAAAGEGETKPSEPAPSVEDKLAGLDPEKAAKVRAAMEAKAAREKARQEAASQEGKGE